MEMNRFIQFNKVCLSKCFAENAKIIGWKVEIFYILSANLRRAESGQPQPLILAGEIIKMDISPSIPTPLSFYLIYPASPLYINPAQN